METKNAGHSVLKKLSEIAIEVLIIVFAVSISIWFHSCNEHRQHQREAREFLADLKDDLANDNKEVRKTMASVESAIKDLEFMTSLTREKIDGLKRQEGTVSVSFKSNITTTKINNGNYEGFKSSGKIGYIENKKIKRSILKYYQQTIPDLQELERINTAQFYAILNYDHARDEGAAEDAVFSPYFEQLLDGHSLHLTGSLIMYREAIAESRELVAEIEQELKSRG
ncbi:MAG TPA: hypothetical protein PLP83_03570 [Candidatus Aminicenantes bacterium]|nr:hypothetical protein [Candidatus Aminicenantes bacterium]